MLPAIRISLLLLVLCGGVYPAAVTLVAQLMPYQANGSLITRSDGTVIGSELIAQPFTSDGYFHARPSAAGAGSYDAKASSGSNLGPTNQKLIDRVKEAADAVRADNPALTSVPADLVTTSGSGLDPDISPAAALAQAPRIAKARGLTEKQVADLIRSQTVGRDLGIFGDPRLNVLKLNLALDAVAPQH
jgi:K+-transporting ATPase ATPase C chain